MSIILPYGPGPGQWDTIKKLLQSVANYDFASGQKMTIKGTVCGNVANASSVQGNGNYSNTGTVGGTEWVGPTGPIHSTYTSQPFDCQWFTVLPPACPSPPNEVSDQLFVDIATASNTAKALAPTQTFAGIDTSMGDVTINVVSGLNVINIPPNPYGTTQGELVIKGSGNLIISGPVDAVVIFNVGADNQVNAVRNGMGISNGRSILTNGGVMAQNILFNVLGGDITINAGVVNGNILVRAGSDVKGKADIQGDSVINGIVIGDGNHSSEFSIDTNATVCGAFASIEVLKEVSPDNGTTWFEANTPTGPNIPQGTDPQFRFTVTNTSNVTLTNVEVTDNVYGLIGAVPSLTAGASAQWVITRPWVAGLNLNIATATGIYEGQTVSDTDPAYYSGILNTSSIVVKKYVSPDGGITFDDADTPPGPNITQGTDPIFRYIVLNDGNVQLTNITLDDSVLLSITIPTTILDPGESFIVDVTGTWALGSNNNIATVTGDDGVTTLTDTDEANYVGVAAVPSIDVEKLVSPDGGLTFDDADIAPGPSITQGTNPIFRYIVTNTGNVTLNNITLTDDKMGIIIIPVTSLNPAESFVVDIPGIWAIGQNTNVATVTGQFDTIIVTDADEANYVGVAAVPTIDVEKLVSPDGGLTFYDADTAPGPNIQQTQNPVFRYIVTNTGNTILSNIILTDDILGVITIPVNTLDPAQSFTVDVTGMWAIGQNTNVATVTGHFETTTVSDTDPANYVGIIVPTSFKQLSVDENLTIPLQKPNAEDILDVLVNVEIIEKRVIKTIKATSEEGQILSGYKLIVEGILHQKVEYIADEPTQTVHAAEFKVPFSSFIILSQDYVEDSVIDVKAYVEDVYVKLLDKRHIFKNVTLRIVADY